MLRDPLNALWDSPESEGQEYVITRDSNSNLRIQFYRICDKAKVDRFEAPFRNMRSSRATELMKDHPIHMVCAWQGDSVKMLMKHYLNVTEEDMKKGAGEAAQNAAQSVS